LGCEFGSEAKLWMLLDVVEQLAGAKIHHFPSVFRNEGNRFFLCEILSVSNAFEDWQTTIAARSQAPYLEQLNAIRLYWHDIEQSFPMNECFIDLNVSQSSVVALIFESELP
jgi:hypothetical protein